MTSLIRNVLTVLGASLTLAGCADKLLSDDRIRDDTAVALNMPAAAVVISDRRYDGYGTTYYTASNHRAVFRCRIEGGNLNSFGLTNPPECSRR
jgi:hypothetical protein